jgi:hypothetical protein
MMGLRLAVTITLLLGGLVSPVAAEAQQAARIARIGYLGAGFGDTSYLEEAFRQGLRGLGYIEGRTP